MIHQEKIEHFFRHEYGNLVAVLSHRIGINHLDAIEDSIQWAMAQALEFWSKEQIPNKPFAWLYKVAYRHLMSEFRSTNRQKNLLLASQFDFDSNYGEEGNDLLDANNQSFATEITDSTLKMMLMACDESVPIESQLVFILKCLCGFSVSEIALRLFISEANVYKRFARAKKILRLNGQEQIKEADTTLNSKTDKALSSIHQVLYLILTEGYLSSHPDFAIRKDLCEEAIRLTLILSKSEFGNQPTTFALLALMHFHFARIESRKSSDGNMLLLADQDRTKWNQNLIKQGMALLERSAQGEEISRFHIEAGIAVEHCLATSLTQTRWGNIVASYELLERISPSPLYLLNKVIAIAEWKSPQHALDELNSASPPNWLQLTYYWYAVKSDLLFRIGDAENARNAASSAIELAPAAHIKELLSKRLITD